MVDLLSEIKKKREFSGLPDSIVLRVLKDLDSDLLDSEKVKEARAILRKYFGVFLTNKVMKLKDIMDYDSVLKAHKSSAKRGYNEFYLRIVDSLGREGVASIIDLGCGVNGFSYSYLKKAFGVSTGVSTEEGNVRYIGVEAVGQMVDNSNVFFDKSGIGDICEVVHGDLFDVNFVEGILKSEDQPRVVFLFQVIDALESMKRNFSKEFLLMVKKNSEFLVVSMPVLSLSGKMIKAKRNWVVDFLNEEFQVLDEFEMNGEKIILLKCK